MTARKPKEDPKADEVPEEERDRGPGPDAAVTLNSRWDKAVDHGA